MDNSIIKIIGEIGEEGEEVVGNDDPLENTWGLWEH